MTGRREDDRIGGGIREGEIGLREGELQGGEGRNVSDAGKGSKGRRAE